MIIIITMTTSTVHTMLTCTICKTAVGTFSRLCISPTSTKDGKLRKNKPRQRGTSQSFFLFSFFSHAQLQTHTQTHTEGRPLVLELALHSVPVGRLDVLAVGRTRTLPFHCSQSDRGEKEAKTALAAVL